MNIISIIKALTEIYLLVKQKSEQKEMIELLSETLKHLNDIKNHFKIPDEDVSYLSTVIEKYKDDKIPETVIEKVQDKFEKTMDLIYSSHSLQTNNKDNLAADLARILSNVPVEDEFTRWKLSIKPDSQPNHSQESFTISKKDSFTISGSFFENLIESTKAQDNYFAEMKCYSCDLGIKPHQIEDNRAVERIHFYCQKCYSNNPNQISKNSIMNEKEKIEINEECNICFHSFTQDEINRKEYYIFKHIYCIKCIRKGKGDFPTMGDYRTLDLLGRGGMADVYKAVQLPTSRIVAFKHLRNMENPTNQQIRRFEKEIQTWANLEHGNIVRVYDAGYQENINLYYIAMEFIEGETLEDRLNKYKKISIDKCIEIAKQLLTAMNYAHKNHIVHRDIKPGNIFLLNDGTIKLSDFGLAKYYDEIGRSAGTDYGTMMGTACYMPIEQIENARDVDHRSDIFAFGATMYELLTGQLPIPRYPTEKIYQYLKRVKNTYTIPSASKFIANIPEQLDHIINKCMNRERQDRFQSTQEILDILNQC